MMRTAAAPAAALAPRARRSQLCVTALGACLLLSSAVILTMAQNDAPDNEYKAMKMTYLTPPLYVELNIRTPFHGFSAPLRAGVDGSNVIRMLTPALGPQQNYDDPHVEPGCDLYPVTFNGAPWFDSALLQDYDAVCSLNTRVYHASLLGVRMMVLFDAAYGDIIRLMGSQPWTSYRYGNSTDPNLNVTDWLAAQPPGEGYGFASPYPEPTVITMRSVDGSNLMNLLAPAWWNGAAEDVYFTMPLPGTLVAEEKMAMHDFARSVTPTEGTDLIATGYGFRLPLTAMLDDPEADPCTMGLAGVWCEDGHVVSLYLASLALAGSFWPSFASLTQLRILLMPNNQLSGVLSDALCNLPLVWLDLSVNNLSGISDCYCGNLTLAEMQVMNSTIPPKRFLDDITTPDPPADPPMLVFNVGTNLMTNLPVSLFACKFLQRVYLGHNQMSEPEFPDLVARNWPAVYSIDLDHAGVRGRVPKFTNMSNMWYLWMGHNQFTGVLEADTFDGMTALTILEAPRLGDVTGGFPNFASSDTSQTGLDINNLDLADNGLIGSMSWNTALVSLQTLSLGGNQLLAPFTGVSLLTQLQYVNLTRTGLHCDGATDFTAFLQALVTSAVMGLYLGGNNLACMWGSSWDAVSTPGAPHFPNLVELNVAGNRLQRIPSTLFRTGASQLWTMLDVSDGDYEGELPSMPTPLTSLANFNALKNPRMNRSLESPSHRMYFVRLGADDARYSINQMLCPPVGYTGNDATTLHIDASYMDYEGCQCDRGFFGTPPACVAVPSTTMWTYDPRLMSTATVVSATATSARPRVLDEAADTSADVPSTTLASTLSLPSFIATQTFTDGYYGGQRYSAGMVTTFEMGVDSTLPEETDSTVVKVLTVTIYLNPSYFDWYTDSISIFTGSDDLKGERVFSVHGSDPVLKAGEARFRRDVNPAATTDAVLGILHYDDTYGSNANLMVQTFNVSQLEASDDANWVALKAGVLGQAPVSGTAYIQSEWSTVELVHVLSIPVFASSATLQFQSLDVSGVHFVASFVTSTRCPDGLEPDSDLTSTKCLDVVRATPEVRTAVFVIAAFAVLVTLGSMVATIFWRENNVIRAAGPPFLVLMCAFMLALSVGSMLYAVLPSANTTSSVVCDLRIWLTSIPLLGILAVLLAKSNRVVSIFTSHSLQRRKVTDGDIITWVVVLLLLQVMMCLVFSSLHLSEAKLLTGLGGNSGHLVQQCTREDGFYSWLVAEIVFVGALALWAAVLAFQTRDVLSAFNESVHLANAVFALIFIACIAVPVCILVHDQQDATVLLQGISQALLVLVWNVALFAPKFYYILTGRVFQAVAAVRAEMGGPKDMEKEPSPGQPGAGVQLSKVSSPVRSIHSSDENGIGKGSAIGASDEGEQSSLSSSSNPLSQVVATGALSAGLALKPFQSGIPSVPEHGMIEFRRDWYPGAQASQHSLHFGGASEEGGEGMPATPHLSLAPLPPAALLIPPGRGASYASSASPTIGLSPVTESVPLEGGGGSSPTVTHARTVSSSLADDGSTPTPQTRAISPQGIMLEGNESSASVSGADSFHTASQLSPRSLPGSARSQASVSVDGVPHVTFHVGEGDNSR